MSQRRGVTIPTASRRAHPGLGSDKLGRVPRQRRRVGNCSGCGRDGRPTVRRSEGSFRQGGDRRDSGGGGGSTGGGGGGGTGGGGGGCGARTDGRGAAGSTTMS